MWFKKMGGKWRKMGEKWDEIPIFHSPIFLIFPEVEELPHNSLHKNQLTALTDGKMGFCATRRHSPPERLVQMLDLCTCSSEIPCTGLLTSCPKEIRMQMSA